MIAFTSTWTSLTKCTHNFLANTCHSTCLRNLLILMFQFVLRITWRMTYSWVMSGQYGAAPPSSSVSWTHTMWRITSTWSAGQRERSLSKQVRMGSHEFSETPFIFRFLSSWIKHKKSHENCFFHWLPITSFDRGPDKRFVWRWTPHQRHSGWGQVFNVHLCGAKHPHGGRKA